MKHLERSWFLEYVLLSAEFCFFGNFGNFFRFFNRKIQTPRKTRISIRHRYSYRNTQRKSNKIRFSITKEFFKKYGFTKRYRTRYNFYYMYIFLDFTRSNPSKFHGKYTFIRYPIRIWVKLWQKYETRLIWPEYFSAK